MPALEHMRTAASSAGALAGPAALTQTNDTTRSSRSAPSAPRRVNMLAHVHSSYMDDHGYYQDELHDYNSESDDEAPEKTPVQLEAGAATDGASETGAKSKEDDEGAAIGHMDSASTDEFRPEPAQEEASGVATADLEKAASRRSLRRSRTGRSGRDKSDPNLVRAARRPAGLLLTARRSRGTAPTTRRTRRTGPRRSSGGLRSSSAASPSSRPCRRR